jgi:signal transduction histidine kinase
MISAFQSSGQRMTELLATLSHELRQPLTMLRAETEEALRLSVPGDDYRSMLAKQLEHLELLTRTVSDVLTMARADSDGIQLQRNKEDLGELVKAAVEGMRMVAHEDNIHISAAIQEGIIAEVDPGQIWRLLLNLLDNAVKYNHPNGKVDVSLTAHDNVAIISIKDTGTGIAPSEQKRIFDMNYRSTAAQASHVPGTGLGLHFVRSITEAHGGKVEVTSTPGQGSCFRVYLPLSAGAPVNDWPLLSASQSGAMVN